MLPMNNFGSTFTPATEEEKKRKSLVVPASPLAPQEPPGRPQEPKEDLEPVFIPATPEEQREDLTQKFELAAQEGYEEDPDDYARRLLTGRELGLPDWVVDDPAIQRRAEIKKLSAKLTEVPEDYSRTMSVLGLPRNMALFKDDIDTFKGVEDVARKATAQRSETPEAYRYVMGRPQPLQADGDWDGEREGPLQKFARLAAAGTKETLALFDYAGLSRKERLGLLTEEEAISWEEMQQNLVPADALSYWEQAQRGVGSSMVFWTRPAARFLRDYGIPLTIATAGAIAAAGTGGLAAPVIGPTLATQITALASGIGSAGYRVQSFTDYQDLSTELAYRSLMSMEDATGTPFSQILGKDVITRLATGIGVATAATETIGVESILGLAGAAGFLPAKDLTGAALMKPTIQRALLQGIVNSTRTWLTETATETAEQAFVIGGEQVAKWLVNRAGGVTPYAEGQEWTTRLMDEAYGASAAFLLSIWGGPGMMNAYNNVRQVQAAKQSQETFSSLVALAEESKGVKRAPRDAAEAINGIVAGSPVEKTFISARRFSEVYSQLGADPKEVARILGIDDAALDAAMATEGRLEVATGDFATHIAGTEAGQALVNDIAFDATGVTLREAQAMEAELNELMRRESEAAEVAFQENESLQVELDKVKTDFLTQTTAAGVEAEAAQANAEIWGAFARTAYHRYGIRPREFSDMVGLEIRQGREVAAGAGNLYQTAFHGSPYRFSRFILDHVGEGEGAQAFGWGLYFAGSRDVAEWYRSRLQNGSPVIKNDDVTYMETNDGWRFSSGQNSDDWSEFNVNFPEVQAEVDGLDLFRDFGYDQKAAEEAIDQALRHPEAVSNAILGDILDSREGRARLERAREFLGNSDLQTAEPGQLYAVDIPGSESLLDWDKPLEEQGDAVRAALAETAERLSGDDDAGSLTGEQLYKRLAYELYGDRDASGYLNELGIKGIRYLDGSSRGRDEGIHNYVVFDDAAIDVLETFYQNQEGGTARGQVAFRDGQSIVTLFETADRSTLLHEMGHVFLNTLHSIAKGNEAASTEWNAIMEFLEVDNWAALTAVQRSVAHETFARTFEGYLMTGEAPSTALQRAFRSFKAWLTDIYRDLVGLATSAGQEIVLSDEAKDIFDRLLATDDEIAEARILTPYTKAIEATQESIRLHGEADMVASEQMRQARTAAETRARRKQLTGQVRRDLEDTRAYRALAAMQESAAKGGLKINEEEFVERYGEMAWSESAAPKRITSKQSTWRLDDLAMRLGYPVADEMVQEITALPPLNEAVKAQVDAIMEREDAQRGMTAESAMRNSDRLAAMFSEKDALGRDETEALDLADAPEWVQLLEEVELAEQDPTSRQNILAEIRELGGIDYQSLKATWGPGEAKTLRDRLGPGPFRKGGRAFDLIVQDLRDEGVYLESTQALYDILMGPEGPLRPELDVAVDQASLPWLVWMMGQDETLKYISKRKRVVGKTLKEATAAFEANRTDEARRARVDAQREKEYITQAQKQLKADLDPDANFKVDFDPATLGQPQEGKVKWTQTTVKEALDQRMPTTSPATLKDAWALASRIARSVAKETRKEAADAQRALKDRIRSIAQERAEWAKAQRETTRARVATARESAQTALETHKVRDLSPRRFIRAEKEAARNVERALKDRNLDEATRQKDVQIANAALAHEAGRVQIEMQEARKYLDGMAKRTKPGAIGGEYLSRIQTVLEGVDLKKTRSRKAVAEMESFLAWKKEQEEAGEVVLIPDRMLALMGRVRFDEFTVGQMRELRDSVKNLEHLGRTKNRLQTDRSRRTFEEAKESLLSSIEKHLGAKYKIDLTPDKTVAQTVASSLRTADAMHRRMEFLLRKMDGNVDLGTSWELIFRPMVDAERAEIAMTEGAAQELASLFDRLEKSSDLRRKRHYPEVGLVLARENLVAIALNMGNDGNRDRMMSGHNWTQPQVMALLKNLSREEWAFVQGTWDFIDSFWPQIAELERDMSGVEPRRVTRAPFVAEASDGSKVQMEGGYYPIVYDREKSPQAYEIDEKKKLQDAMSTQAYRAATRHGHTKARVRHATLPLDLNLSTISTHVAEVIHDLTHRRAVRDVSRILEDRAIQTAITEALGPEYYREFKPWLKHVALGRDLSPRNGFEKALARGRHGVTITVLGAKVTTALMQVMSIFGAAERLGTVHMLNSIQDFYRNPLAWKEKVKFVMDNSPEVRTRKRRWDRDVRDVLNRNLGRGRKAQALSALFWGAGMMDAAAVIPVWREAYQMKLDVTGDKTKAIYYADSVVRQTQPANSAKDVAGIMRGHESRKLFTMFYGYWNVFYNLFVSSLGATKGVADIPRLAGTFLWMIAVPAALGPLVTRRGPDDDEDPFKWAAGQILAYPFNAVIGVRDIASAIQSPQWGYSLTPASRGFESIAQLGIQAKQAIMEGDDWDDIIRPLGDVIGIWGHFPVGQARITFGQFLRYMSGDMPDYNLADVFLRRRR